MGELQPVRGTRDFYPDERRLHAWLFGLWRAVAESFGYQEYDACVLEHEELYVRKAGDEITQQLYHFEDKGGRRLALRPEMTPSLARMIIARQGNLALPLRWYSIPQCFRYERMQRGRKREHYQWNMDVVGLGHVAGECELMSAQLAFLQRAGLDAEREVALRVSDRRILQGFLAGLGVVDERFAAACIVIDKADKIGRQAVIDQLGELAIDEADAERVLDLLALDSLDEVAGAVGEDNPGVQALQQLQELAAAAGFAEQLRVDPAIVRGLSYYTGTVWELFAVSGSLKRALAGGGRYDDLLATLGGRPLPMVGFGFGDVTILELLEELGRLPDLPGLIDDVVYPMGEDEFAIATRLARALRASGRRVAVDYSQRRFKHVVQRADQGRAERLLVIGSRERADGVVNVRRIADRSEQKRALAEFGLD